MGLGAAASVLIGVWGFVMRTADDRVMTESSKEPKKKQKSDLFVLDPIADRLGRPLTGIAMDLMASRRSKIRRRIDRAGRPGGMTVESYCRQSAGYLVLFGGLGLFLFLNGSTFIGAICLLGIFQKEFLLFSRIQSRQDTIDRMMPDFLDVLTVTVSAGLNFRHALARVNDSMPGALAEEFNVALRQMELGTPRRDAFEDLRTRNSSPALDQFVTALLQAEELGAPLTSALVDISTDMRRESAQRAKRKAQRITPRITAVSTALTLPSLMLIVLGAMFFGSGVNVGGIFGGQ
ncbi:MAG: type II secretion system F family protein [Streptosporangiaceae bacterium]